MLKILTLKTFRSIKITKQFFRSILRKAKSNYYQDKKYIKQTWNVFRKVVNSTILKLNIPDQFHCNGKIF